MTTLRALEHLKKAYNLLNAGGDMYQAKKIKQVIVELEQQYTYTKKYFYFCKTCCHHWESVVRERVCHNCFTEDIIEENYTY